MPRIAPFLAAARAAAGAAGAAAWLCAALGAAALAASDGARAAAVGEAGSAGAAPESSPAVLRLLARIEASPAGCRAADPAHPDTRAMEAEIALFRARLPRFEALPIDLRECFWDGMVVRGERVVLSTRLARATPAQRFFIIAHEAAHLAAGHHARLYSLAAALLRDAGGDAVVAAARLPAAMAPLSRANETEADAIAVAWMLAVGLDPDEAARFLEAAAAGSPGFARPPAPSDEATHPPLQARAAAVRRLAAALPAPGAAVRVAAAPPPLAAGPRAASPPSPGALGAGVAATRAVPPHAP